MKHNLTNKICRRFKIIIFALIGAAFTGVFTGCGSGDKTKGQEDILTQKAVSDDRENITILVKYAFTINGFEKAVEEKFPNINIVQVGNYTHDMGIDEYAARMEKDDLTDIVMTWPVEVGEEYRADRLLDLSGMEFTNKYNVSTLDELSQDGALYYLPGPAQVRGIVYNKTMFEENGWQVPKDFNGFMELCQTIESSGIRALQLGFKNAEVLDTAFVGFSYADCFSTPQDTQWIREYNHGNHSLKDQFMPAFHTFQMMIDKGIFKKEDLEIGYADRETMFFKRQCAMVEDSVLLARMGEAQTGTTDEFALMPFFNPDDGGAWARLYMVCYIGLNKHLAEPENKKKYDLVMELMNYISSSEGQQALMSDTGAMYSSLAEVGAPNVPEIKDLLPALKQGNYAIFPTSQNAQATLREGLAGMISGEMTTDEVITMVDQQNVISAVTEKPNVIGTASEDFTVLETGNFVTDVMRKAGDCDVALFLDNGKDGRYNGKGISARLYKGDLTEKDVMRVWPDLKHGETGTLWKITMTGENLINTLEHSITVDNNVGGWFYYFSGLRMEYAPAAEPGERIHSISMDDKSKIDPKKIYSIAVMDDSVPEEYIESCEKTEIKITDLIKEAIKKAQIITPSKDGRFVIAESK